MEVGTILKTAFALTLLTFVLTISKSIVFTCWYARTIIEQEGVSHPSIIFNLIVNCSEMVLMYIICYFTSLPRASTSIFNKLFLAFNILILANIIAVVFTIIQYNGDKISRWYIGVECLTIFTCTAATGLWLSQKKDGFKRYVTPVDFEK